MSPMGEGKRIMHIVDSTSTASEESAEKKFLFNQIDVRYGKLALENIIGRIVALRPDLKAVEDVLRGKRRMVYSEDLVNRVREVADYLKTVLKPGQSFNEVILNQALDRYFVEHRADFDV